MAVRDSVKVVSRAKPHVSRSIGRIGNLIDDGSPRALRFLERERRYLNALGFSVRSQITSAIEAEILSALDEQRNLEELERLGALAEQAADRLTLSEIKRIQGDIKRARELARARRDFKMGDRAIRRIAAEGVSAKAPLMGEFTESSMELARRAHPQVWVWTANASACAVCLSLHGSRREGNFNPPHPNCLCIAEAPGQSRPLTDDEIADQMIKRGGRDAELGRALKGGQIDRGQLRVRREGIIKQRNFDIPEVGGPTARYRNADFLDNVAASPTEDFYSGFAQAKQGKYGGFLSDLTEADFDADNIRVYTAFDGKVGAALTDHGDGRIEIGSLFAAPDAPDGAGRDMLRYLIRERDGNFLTNFDGPLTEFYRAEGFEVISRSPFAREFAPEGWNYDLFGTPDYVEMSKVKK